ncbi:hypothetical protein DFA_12143 [Cavenderia fasciculata]|uniref:Uncharacterized protein n=1 Tax=Cavenderia fasciculata TaxID=261658 RepID=F4QC90_CACFS|nr:uncharacterized protein DFA_12143 [Cavenderia fasciculata]EGG14371.1 hypothetical protein DFA_12143 [Cavenderia fasciculata]|eukprot:XP_004353780.1 hypothetical protein DFA_12143 [Cavenderia fasciculata]
MGDKKQEEEEKVVSSTIDRHHKKEQEQDDDNDDDDEQELSLSDMFPPCEEVEIYHYNINDINLKIKGQQLQNINTQPSTGLLPWPAASILFNFIAINNNLFNNKKVLELGTGVGVCGLVASKFCASILMTDGDLSTLGQLSDNLDLNSSIFKVKPSIRHLYWGKDNQGTLDSVQKDFNEFDIVIGSDLIYQDASIEPLFYTVNQLLSKSNPENAFYLSFLDRKNHLPILEKVSSSYGFEMQSLPVDSFLTDLTNVSTMSKMFIFKRKETQS